MKRITILFSFALFACALLFARPAAAFAAEVGDGQASRVNITVVMPDASPNGAQEPPATGTQPQDSQGTGSPSTVQPETVAPAPTPVPAPALYPVTVDEIGDANGRRIVKVYELSPAENPAHISREPFTRDGWRYELADITRAETAFADSRDHTETVTLNTDTNDTNAILRQLAPTLEFETEDGYAGVLTLNVATIKVEQAGTKTSSFTVSATREYPRLSAADTSLVPKTVTDSGRTLTLAKVDWKAGNRETVDYEEMPEYYTACATYTGTGSKTVVTGYVTTAEYSGTVGKINQGKTVYTAYFLGTEIKPERIPLEIIGTAPTSAPPIEGAPATDGTEAVQSATPAQEAQSAPPETLPPETGAALPTETPTAPPFPEVAENPANTRAVSPLSLVVTTAIIALVIGGGGAYIIMAPIVKTQIS